MNEDAVFWRKNSDLRDVEIFRQGIFPNKISIDILILVDTVLSVVFGFHETVCVRSAGWVKFMKPFSVRLAGCLYGNQAHITEEG